MAVFRIGANVVGRMMNFLVKGSFPRTVRIETTNHCNAACTFCPRESIGRDKGFMDQALFEKVVDECVEGKCKSLHMHNFGEPLMDKKLPERIAYAKQRGIPKITIFCNGAFLKGPLAERLVTSGLDELKVSIDGADAEEFDRLRIGLNHQTTVDHTREFRKLRNKMNQRGPTIVATCSQTSNRKQTIKLLRDVVDRVDFAHLHNWAGARTWLMGGRKIRKPCDRLWRTFTVLVNGDIALCCLDYSGKEILGNVREHSIREIWHNARYQELRLLHRTSRQDQIDLCRDCTKSYL